MTTVLTVAGLGANLGWIVGQPDVMGDFYQRQCTTVGQTLPERVAPGWGAVTQVIKVDHSVLALARAFRRIDHNEPVLVMAHSMGDLAVLYYLRRFTDRDPTNTRFLLSGANIDMVRTPEVTSQPYPIVNVVLQWEKYSDPPTVRSSRFFQAAIQNIRLLGLHTCGYQKVSLRDEPAAQVQEGSVLSVFYPSPLPAAVDTAPQIETAYNRTYLK